MEVQNDPIQPTHVTLSVLEEWGSCLRCHDYHGNHVWTTPIRLEGVASEASVARYLQQAIAQTSDRGRVILWAKVTEEGRVAEARVHEGSGKEYLDAVSVGIATRMEFLPARLDRLAVPVWIQLPFNMR